MMCREELLGSLGLRLDGRLTVLFVFCLTPQSLQQQEGIRLGFSRAKITEPRKLLPFVPRQGRDAGFVFKQRLVLQVGRLQSGAPRSGPLVLWQRGCPCRAARAARSQQTMPGSPPACERASQRRPLLRLAGPQNRHPELPATGTPPRLRRRPRASRTITAPPRAARKPLRTCLLPLGRRDVGLYRLSFERPFSTLHRCRSRSPHFDVLPTGL